MRRIISLAGVLAVVPLVQLGPFHPAVAVAHPGPHPPSPPTHDYDTENPGTQGPTSPVLANPRDACSPWLG